MSDGPEIPEEEPVAELEEFEVDPHADLAGRVLRDINRRTLVADGLDFSMNVMLGIFWEHLKAAIDSMPGRKKQEPDQAD